MNRVLAIKNIVSNQINKIYFGLFLILGLAFSTQPAAAFATDALNNAQSANPFHIAFFVLSVISMVVWQTRPEVD